MHTISPKSSSLLKERVRTLSNPMSFAAIMKQTKKQLKESAQKEALRRRVADVAIGSAGYSFDVESKFATPDFLSRFVPALEVLFAVEKREWMWKAHNMDKFENIDTTTHFLYEHGVRA